ncbi:UvrD-helicase domain-containing protein [Salinibaculum rarum]|uniref:UvrD-helicase domain-containing protein n=1 Tax=Salinibaculum rarum TaxID=3058903 RepID=UPI00265EA129|nr:UvrD-helicase domain-containing protein [Salinibaculum sp. KK48]
MQRDDSTVVINGNVDWDTFEDIESYVSQGASSVFEWVIPTVLWESFCAPTSRDAALLRRSRASVSEEYRGVSGFYEGTESELIERSHLSTEGGEYESISGLLEDINPKFFPASLTPPDQQVPPRHYATLSEEITALEEAISEEKDAVETSECLLSNPEAAFLYEEERADLVRIRNVLSYSVEAGTRRKDELVNKRTEVIESLDQRIEDWQEEIDRLESRAKPYLDLETVDDVEGLVADVQALEADLESVRDEQPLSMVSDSLVTQFNEIEQRALFLSDELQQSRAEFAEAELEQMLTSVRNSFLDVAQRVKAAQENGDALDSPQTLLEEIAALRGEIKSVRESPHASNAPESRVNDITQYETRLDEYEAYIEEKTWFDSEIEAHADALTRLREDAEPYLNFDRYLREPQRATLTTKIHPLVTELKELDEEADFSVLSGADQRQLQELQTEVGSVRAHLKEYNSAFVRQQREESADLFSDIGPSDLDLTKEQQRAVIRNGIYNQVIAAAGTGKTLTLTTRVAYLINAQCIDPNRILVVTYTREARTEMQERLADHFGITDVEVRTVNSFGQKLLQNAQDGYVDLVDEDEQVNLIEQTIRNARNDEDSEFLKHYYEFLVHFDDVYFDEAAFETKKEYVQARRDENYVTLKGTEVRSRAEKLIADFLYTHQVDYRYEDRATWAETDPEKAGYNPDFYLPAYDVYIEHWGVDESGSVAPWFSWSSEEYREKMQWVRQQFTAAEYKLIDTYEFEHETDRLKQALRHRLAHHGVELDRMGFEELVETAFEYEHREGWIKKQFQSFIENAKRFDVMPDDIKANLSPQNPRQYHFGHCGIQLLQEYALYLTRNGLIDYTDQIQDAVELIQKHPSRYKTQYDHVLVDEFQDIGAGKLELIQELTGQDAANLFAVGDDWQSIYSFQGAAVQYFTEFDEHFGEPVRTDLTANFRSPPSVINSGNDLIKHNSKQLEKTVRATVDSDAAPHVHTLRGYKDRFYDYVRRVRRYTVTLVREYIAAGADPSEIMVLCRYDGARPFLDEIKQGLQSQEIPYVGKSESDQYRGATGQAVDGVSVYAVHQAKGREAEHVILVDAAEGPYGFPPNERDNELLRPVQPLGIGGIEEERRTFYVAVTRAKRSLDLLTRANQESRFLEEIAEHTEVIDTGQVEPLDDVGDRMTVEVKVEELSDPWRKQHQRGILADKYGGAARFISWKSDLPPTLEEDEWYHLSDVLVDEYNDEKELVISSEQAVTHLPDGPQEPKTAKLPNRT